MRLRAHQRAFRSPQFSFRSSCAHPTLCTKAIKSCSIPKRTSECKTIFIHLAGNRAAGSECSHVSFLLLGRAHHGGTNPGHDARQSDEADPVLLSAHHCGQSISAVLQSGGHAGHWPGRGRNGVGGGIGGGVAGLDRAGAGHGHGAGLFHPDRPILRGRRLCRAAAGCRAEHSSFRGHHRGSDPAVRAAALAHADSAAFAGKHHRPHLPIPASHLRRRGICDVV